MVIVSVISALLPVGSDGSTTWSARYIHNETRDSTVGIFTHESRGPAIYINDGIARALWLDGSIRFSTVMVVGCIAGHDKIVSNEKNQDTQRDEKWKQKI